MAKDIRYTLLILAIALFTTANLYAQNSKCAIAGKVVDVNQEPIAYASAAVYNATVPITGAITDNDGKFSLKVGQSNEEFLLVIEFIGYARHEISITPNTSHINIGTITHARRAIPPVARAHASLPRRPSAIRNKEKLKRTTDTDAVEAHGEVELL